MSAALPLRGPFANLREQPGIVLVILAIIAIKAIAIFLVLPLLAHSMSGSYGIGFADDYDKLAWTLSQGLGCRFFPDTAPTLTREPGYPLFLAGLLFHLGG